MKSFIAKDSRWIKAVPELVTRVTLGWIFIESGWGKLHNLDNVISFFESLNIPFAFLQAPFVSVLELGCGILILLGLLTRLAALPLILIMIVAICTAKREELFDFSMLSGTSEFLFITLLLWLSAYGSQIFSLDQLIRKKMRKG